MADVMLNGTVIDSIMVNAASIMSSGTVYAYSIMLSRMREGRDYGKW